MDAEHNHIALLQHRAKNSGNTVLLKLPVLRGSEPPQAWTDVTVAEFAADVDRIASFLITELNARAIPPRSPITFLSSGSRYQDLVYTIALSRACYIPQMITSMLTNPEAIFGLMEKAGSKMILYDPSLEHLTANCPFPKMVLRPIESIEGVSTLGGDSALPKIEDLPPSSDVGFIFLTSGSTSGSPKVVPLTHKALSIKYRTQSGLWFHGEQSSTGDVLLGLVSISHLPGMTQYLRCLYTKTCFIKPSRGPLPNEELLNMVNSCGLNRMITYGTWLAPHIRAAKEDPLMLALLRKMRSITYTGVAIQTADDDWCFQNGITLICVYGTTESGRIMMSVPGKASRFLGPPSDVSYSFDLVADATTAQVDSPASAQLFEFVLLADSLQVPHTYFISADGNLHTGDLFEKQLDESYVFRGRNDDWIKTADTDRVDARAIEKKIYETCSDLVKECVVVGYLRPSPALFVEVHHGQLSDISGDSLKETIISRIQDFNARQYAHEQINDKRLIFLVEEGILPRTLKGNIRRRTIEEKYPKELEAMYESVYGS